MRAGTSHNLWLGLRESRFDSWYCVLDVWEQSYVFCFRRLVDKYSDIWTKRRSRCDSWRMGSLLLSLCIGTWRIQTETTPTNGNSRLEGEERVPELPIRCSRHRLIFCFPFRRLIDSQLKVGTAPPRNCRSRDSSLPFQTLLGFTSSLQVLVPEFLARSRGVTPRIPYQGTSVP